MLPVITILGLLIPIIGNFYPNPPVSPFTYFAYTIGAWISIGIAVVLLLKRFRPEEISKIGNALSQK